MDALQLDSKKVKVVHRSDAMASQYERYMRAGPLTAMPSLAVAPAGV